MRSATYIVIDQANVDSIRIRPWGERVPGFKRDLLGLIEAFMMMGIVTRIFSYPKKWTGGRVGTSVFSEFP